MDGLLRRITLASGTLRLRRERHALCIDPCAGPRPSLMDDSGTPRFYAHGELIHPVSSEGKENAHL
jgi:hypothetical protein